MKLSRVALSIRSGSLALAAALSATAALASAQNKETPAAAPVKEPTTTATAATAPASSAKLETPAQYRTEFKLPSGEVVKRGMPVAELQKLMGEPREKRPMKAGNEVAEIWIYQTDTVTSAPKTIHSDTIVTADNHQGWVETVSVPQYKIEQTIVTETRELLIFQGRLLNWKESRSVKRTMQ